MKDCYATGKNSPIVDEHQDWFILDSKQVDGYTMLKIKRKLETCDKNDQTIREGSTLMIFAWNNYDPKNENDWQYHGKNRRTQTALLLDFKDTDLNEQSNSLPADTITYDVIPTEVFNYKMNLKF